MAGRKYSDVLKIANTSYIANSDILVLERADGKTYAFYANSIVSTLTAQISTQRSFALVDTASTFYANVNSDVILCDPNSVGGDVTVVLPAEANNKVYTIKNIDPGIYSVIVTTSNTELTVVENALGGGIGNSTSLTSVGEVYTWMQCSGVYRKIS